MSTFWLFLVDFLILGVLFTGMQYLGFLLLFLIFVIEIGRLYASMRSQSQKDYQSEDQYVSV